ncbi:MAG: prepilin-type N-terminal cleavage/methylation domain-containing protein [Campylobacterales bacterium]|nr:prepilin-type N-terminal cleavage/methylation domain-containing protein [Campylobacterales bacterium]
MHKKAKRAFTLIEVMVAVMIISVVILALIEMFANNIHIFSGLKKQIHINPYSSFFISNPDYGLETKNAVLYDLVSDFKLEDDLQRELKNNKIEVVYQVVEQIDLSEYDNTNKDESKQSNGETAREVKSNVVFEIGKTVIKTKDASTALLRLRIKQ